ncbi:MAG: hypothetical protein RLZZ345_626, partial [Actinomycetota bacterium]
DEHVHLWVMCEQTLEHNGQAFEFVVGR